MIPRFFALLIGICFSSNLMAQPLAADVQNAAVARQETEKREALAAGVSPFVTSMLPTVDTNVGIGISYPPGSSDYIYLVAGIRPPGGDPRLPSTTTNILAAPPAVAGPLVTYEPAAAGAREVMTREVIGNRIIEFPPGAWIRGFASMRTARPVSSAPRPISLVPIEVASRTESGEELIQNFPPGARLVRNAPAAAPQK